MISKFIFVLILSLQLSIYADDIDSMKESYKNADPLQKIETLNNIAVYYHEISADSSIKYANLALKIPMIEEYPKQHSIALNCLALGKSLQGKYNEALRIYESSKKIVENSPFKAQLALIYSGLGDIYKNISSNYNNALKQYLTSLEIYEQLDQPIKKIKILEKVGKLYIDLKEPEKAIEYFRQTVDLAQKYGDDKEYILAKHLLGQVTMLNGDFDKGLEYCMTSLKQSEDLGYKLTEASIRSDLADMYIFQGETRRARSLHIIARKINQEYGNLNGILRNIDGISQSYFFDRKIDKAIEYAKKGIDFANNNKIPNTKFYNLYQILSRSYEAKDDNENALRYYKVYTSLKDQIFNSEKSKQISELQVAHETQKKENEIKELMVNEQKNTILFTSIVGALIFVIAVIFIILYRNKRKSAIELGKAKVEAEKADKLKTAILSNMTHEVKTPLNFINSSSMLLKLEMNEKNLSEDANEALHGLNDGVHRLNRTVDLFMTLATVKSGNYQLNRQEMNIDQLVNEIYNDYKLISEKEKPIKIEYINSLENCRIINDEQALNVIVKNIVDNAVKFTNEGQVVIKTFKNENNKCTIEIADTGVGIDKDYIDRIFEPFTQEEMEIDRSYDGNGLGLALAKEFASIIDSEIKVESEKGKGSKFTIILN